MSKGKRVLLLHRVRAHHFSACVYAPQLQASNFTTIKRYFMVEREPRVVQSENKRSPRSPGAPVYVCVRECACMCVGVCACVTVSACVRVRVRVC